MLVIIAAIAITSIAIVGAMLSITRTVQNRGNIKAIGVNVYWDQACTNETASVPWGQLEPNSTVNNTIYIKNNGTAPCTLAASYGNWNPPTASLYISPSWNCTSYVLNNGTIVGAFLTLTISPSITGIQNFSYDMNITGTG
jgi:hypothetical protein